ncbi:hypothetical protein [Flavobacterium sp.]|uniref:Ig-like domain-containing protein n=1 Tax=Flavobacterium sp. TaxID=239 RepID=UPI0035283604
MLTDATANANNGTLTNFTLNGATSNWLAGSPITTGSTIPSNATVTTPAVYNQGDNATELTATGGTGLLWYTTATGGTGSTTVPTPDTSIAGTTSYWVSSTNANGCESERIEIVVQVNAPATYLNFDGVNDAVAIATNSSLPLGNNLETIEAWIKTAIKYSWWLYPYLYGDNPANNRLGLYQTGGKTKLCSSA